MTEQNSEAKNRGQRLNLEEGYSPDVNGFELGSPMKRGGNYTTTSRQLTDGEKQGSAILASEISMKTPHKSKKASSKKRIRIDGEAFNTETKVVKKMDQGQEVYDA